MNNLKPIFLKPVISSLLGLTCQTAVAVNFSGHLGIEGQYFPNAPIHTGQSHHHASINIQAEWRHNWNNGRSAVNFVPFYRWDNQDKERTHGDIRELDYLTQSGNWEIQAGISKVFWGVTESQHLVDIINQTDLVEAFNGEEKLGQPMIRINHLLDSGSIDFFVLPYFRERTFAGTKGRLRASLPVDTSQTTYESSRKQQHLDYAIRLNQSGDQTDWGIYWFQGTSRDPDFNLGLNNGRPVLVPHYAQIKQLGVDWQFTGDEWLWKLEAIHRKSNNQSYSAMVGGFEYSFYGINDSDTDIGLIAEYHHDTRGQNATSPLQRDLFIGSRIGLNDVDSSQLLAGVMLDLDGLGQSVQIEASRRIGNNLKLNLEAQWIIQAKPTAVSYPIRDDDNIKLELEWYF